MNNDYEYIVRSEKPIRFMVGADTDVYAVYCITEHHGDLCDMSKLKSVLKEAVSACKGMGRTELAKAYKRLLSVLENTKPIVTSWNDNTTVEQLIREEN